MSRDKQIKSTDWLTRGMTEAELAKAKEKAIKEAEAELRDKQIEEMAKLCTDKCRDCHNNECIETTKSQHCIAETLYNAGYRKASEVAEEIFAEIEKIAMHGTTVYGLCLMSMGEAAFAELKKKYTEEGNGTNN